MKSLLENRHREMFHRYLARKMAGFLEVEQKLLQTAEYVGG
jgi:hypothetical protein